MVGALKLMLALHGVLHRRGEDFAIGNIVRAAAGDGADAFDGKAQVGAGAFDFDEVGGFHGGLERLHAGLHLRVIEGADIEVKILEGLGAHAGALGHAGGWPAQDAPLGLLDPPVEHRLHLARDEFHLLRRHVAHLGDVIAAAHGDVGVHLFHLRELDGGGDFELLLLRVEGELAADPPVMHLHERHGADVACGADDGDGHFIGNLKRVDEHLFPRL